MITWNIGTVGIGASGFVTVGLRAANPYSGTNPAVNTANLVSASTAMISDTYRVGVSQSGLVCSTYYFHNDLVNVGADGSQQAAATNAPLVSDPGTNIMVTVNTVSFTAITSFYQNPAASNGIDFTGTSLTTKYFIDRSPGNATTIRVTVYDYDSATGARVQLGQSTDSYGGSQTGAKTFTFNFTSGTLPKNHRLLWTFEGQKSSGGGTDTIYFQYGGTVTNPVSSGTTFADANGQLCTTPPANPTLDKQVSQLLASPGDTLAYTIKFGNTGLISMTNSLITDTLPTGTTFVTATLNGSPTTPTIAG